MKSLGTFRLTATCKLHLHLGDLTAFEVSDQVNQQPPVQLQAALLTKGKWNLSN